MPKIRINPINITGNTIATIGVRISYVFERNYWRSKGTYVSYYSKTDTCLIGFNYIFSKPLAEYVPENAYLTSLNLNFYVVQGETGSSKTAEVHLPGKPFVVPFTNTRGWNTVKIDGPNIPDLSEVTKIYFNPLGPKYSERRFYTGQVCAPSEPVVSYDKKCSDEYSMPSSYVYEFYNLSSSNAPYIELEYEYNPPQSADNLNPNALTINPRSDIRFSWNSLINQTGFELQYNVNSTSWKSVVESTSNRFYDMPVNTITATSGLVEWRVRVMEESGVYSDWSTASFTLGTVPQEPPRIVRPAGDYLKNGVPIIFEWDFISNTTEQQEEYEIEISLPSETKTLTGGSADNHVVDLELTDSLVVYWRMRVKNQFDEWSDWTEKVSFQTIGFPPAPQIVSIENNNRPLLKWNSREQESYQITVEDTKGQVILKTPNILGTTAREYKLKEFIPNGKYLFKLKITNAYGIESEETEYTHIIDPEPIDEPTINLYKSDFFVEISSTSLDGEVLRDGKLIGNLRLGKFRDYTGANYKTYSYQIRVFENDVVGLSQQVGGVTEFGEINTLATVDDLSNYFKISYGLDEPVTKTIEYSIQGTEVQLEGKKYPFVEFSSHSTAGFSLSFYVEKLEQVKELKALVEQRKEFLLRESRGKNIQGVLYGFNAEYHSLGYKISCAMTVTGEDYD